MLEVDGVKVNQSGAICRYLAELAGNNYTVYAMHGVDEELSCTVYLSCPYSGLLGKTPVERVQIDALADTVLGLAENAVPAFFEGADVVVKVTRQDECRSVLKLNCLAWKEQELNL